MNRIDNLFKTKKNNILSVFFTAGFPKLNDTHAVATALQRAGADLIEIGIPFSDPVADGPVIQESNKIALDNGMNLKLLLEQVKEIRKLIDIPILLMGYLNPVFQYGVEKFCEDASKAGVDGVILPDLPLKEFKTEYQSCFQLNNLCTIFLISPNTSQERIREVDNLSSGFVYAVSASSTTGAKAQFSDDQVSYFKKIQSLQLKNPVMIGFGISDDKSFTTACRYASGAIVGSAFINTIKNSNDLEMDVKKFVESIKH